MSYIEIKNISKSYKDKQVLENLSLSIEKEKFVSFVGPFGSGKTTLLKVLSGIEEVDKGSIFINGESPKELILHKKIGFAFQQTMLLPWRNVLENIYLPSEINGEKDENKAKKLIKLVGLENKEECYPDELSGGMQRIVSILRAIMLKPAILLLDEPLSAIDEINRDELHEKLIDIHKKNNQTTILVTHSIHEAVYLSDEVYVFGSTPTKVIEIIKPQNPRNINEKFSINTLKEVSLIRDCLREVIKNA